MAIHLHMVIALKVEFAASGPLRLAEVPFVCR
jgi:hypothetical protein